MLPYQFDLTISSTEGMPVAAVVWCGVGAVHVHVDPLNRRLWTSISQLKLGSKDPHTQAHNVDIEHSKLSIYKLECNFHALNHACLLLSKHPQ